MQILASKYCLVFIIMAIVLLSFKFGGEQQFDGKHQSAEKLEHRALNQNITANFADCLPPNQIAKDNSRNLTQNQSNLITNCDFAGADQITRANSPVNSHQIIAEAIDSGNINYRCAAGQLYTLVVMEAHHKNTYLCFLAINIPENSIHKGMIVAKYKKSTQSKLAIAKNMRFKIIAYRQSSYLRGIEEIKAEKIRNDWSLQDFATRHKLYLA